MLILSTFSRTWTTVWSPEEAAKPSKLLSIASRRTTRWMTSANCITSSAWKSFGPLCVRNTWTAATPGQQSAPRGHHGSSYQASHNDQQQGTGTTAAVQLPILHLHASTTRSQVPGGVSFTTRQRFFFKRGACRGEGYSKFPRHGNGSEKAFRPLCSALPIYQRRLSLLRVPPRLAKLASAPPRQESHERARHKSQSLSTCSVRRAGLCGHHNTSGAGNSI